MKITATQIMLTVPTHVVVLIVPARVVSVEMEFSVRVSMILTKLNVQVGHCGVSLSKCS